MREAYHAETALNAQSRLEALARELVRTHPGAAASLREELLSEAQLGITVTGLLVGMSPSP
jgi:hypothetical protein